MARANRKEVLKKEVQVKKTSGVTGIKEESEKGELFFKIVLIVMAAAILFAATWLIVSLIIGGKNSETETKYHSNNYVSLSNVQQIVNGENFENLTHAGLKEALDNYEFVYVMFVAEMNATDLSEAVTSRQDAALEVVDKLFANKNGFELGVDVVGDDEYTIFVLNENTAFFFVDTTLTDNTNWQQVVNTSEGQASNASLPTLLEIVNGEDLNWFGPWAAAGKNPATLTKLNEILAGLN